MKGQRAKEALGDINRVLASRKIPSSYLNQARIDHTTDMNSFYASVVFNERCTMKLLQSECYTKKNQVEAGTFFYGKVRGNTLYIDTYLSDFEHADGVYRNCAVDVTDHNLKELDLMTEKSEFNQHPYNVVVHFHTHPSVVINRNGVPITPNTFRYSEQDLYTYGYLQKYSQPVSDNFVLFIGGLMGINDERTQISMVFYDAVRKDFFNISNIYFLSNGELHKFNNFDITNSKKIEDTSGIKLMKELKGNN